MYATRLTKLCMYTSYHLGDAVSIHIYVCTLLSARLKAMVLDLLLALLAVGGGEMLLSLPGERTRERYIQDWNKSLVPCVNL